jgi:ribosome-associated translation inhibitor RaiA/DNA-directed RNA polymerase specialized sigma24 family protein
MSLSVTFSYKNLNPQEHAQVERYMEEKLRKIEKLVRDPHALFTVRVEKFVKKSAFKAEFVLRIAGRSYRASEDDHTIAEVIDFTLDKLMRQIERNRERTRPAHSKYPRKVSLKERWTELEERLAPPHKEADREDFFKAIEALVKPAIALIHHEIEHLKLARNIDEDEYDAATIIDDAVLKLWEERRKKPASLTLQQWFYRTAFDILNGKLKESDMEDDALSIDRVVPEESEAFEVSNMGDEVKDFWQPDEVTTIADTIGANISSQGLAPTQKKQYRKVLQALHLLPHPARQAFLLKFREGFQEEEIALIQKRSIALVKKDLASSLQLLRQKAGER